ncbi:MAG: hypothetical protein R3C03_00075 [Pirellulaceae bacterium]
MMTKLDLILSRLRSATVLSSKPDSYKSHCPAHDDRNKSLSVARRNGKILMNCHTGCTVDSIPDAIGRNSSDLYEDMEQ